MTNTAPTQLKNPTPADRRSLETPFLWKLRSGFYSPPFYNVAAWRQFVYNQPFMMDCRTAIIDRVMALPWQIVTKDPTEKRRRGSEIDRIEELIEDMGGEGYDVVVEKALQDALDTTVGGALETSRDDNGNLTSFYHMDAATLLPTGASQVPLLQYNPYYSANPPTVFDTTQCVRMGYSPRSEIQRAGWMMPPPEKIYIAANLLGQGDKYYMSLLSDTPEAGILDLLDMSQKSAEEWADSFRDTLLGNDAFKIPVLYEHEKAAQWIAFTRSPQEIVYNEITLRYAAFVAAGYGITLQDIGLQPSGGGAGGNSGSSNRSRQTRKTGIGAAVSKLTRMINRALPEYLQFVLDYVDEEDLVARGRARVSTFTAFNTAVAGGWLGPEEARAQVVADGLMNIDLDPSFKPQVGLIATGNKALPQLRKDPATSGSDRAVGVSQGGEGDVNNRTIKSFAIDLGEKQYEYVRTAGESSPYELFEVVFK